MIVDFDYRISCNSRFTQNLLIDIFKQWATDLNSSLSSQHDPINITTYRMKTLKNIRFSSKLEKEIFISKQQKLDVLEKGLVVNGITLDIWNPEASILNCISLVFVHHADKNIAGRAIQIYRPDQQKIQNNKAPPYHITNPFFFIRYESYWYLNLLNLISSLSPKINVFINSEPLDYRIEDPSLAFEYLAKNYRYDCDEWTRLRTYDFYDSYDRYEDYADLENKWNRK